MAYTPLNNAFYSVFDPCVKPPCVVPTGKTSGALAYPRTRMNFVSTLAAPYAPDGTPLLTVRQLQAGAPWKQARPECDRRLVQPQLVNNRDNVLCMPDPTIPTLSAMKAVMH